MGVLYVDVVDFKFISNYTLLVLFSRRTAFTDLYKHIETIHHDQV